MLHRDSGENLSALDPRDTQGLFIISTWSSHLWLSLESIKLPHFPGTWHRHLCLYEMQRTQSRVLQIGPCCSSSEVQDFNFYHIFFYHLSPFSHLPPFLRNSWGYKNAAHLQTLIEFLSSQPPVQGSCPGWGNFPLQYREKNKEREASPSSLSLVRSGITGGGAAWAFKKDQRRKWEKFQMWYMALASTSQC